MQESSNRAEAFEVIREFRGELMPLDLQPAFIEGNSVTFIGCYEEFLVQFSNLAIEIKKSLRYLTLELHGDVTKQLRRIVEGATRVFGAICLCPLALLLCHCYKRFIFEQRKLDIAVYTGLADCIKECKGLERLTINVADSFLNRTKCDVIDRAVTGLTRLTRFNFQNLMGEYDSLDAEYSTFDKTFQKVKDANRVNYRITWGSKAFSNELPNSMNNTAITIAELLNTDGNNILSDKHPTMTDVLKELPLRGKQSSSRDLLRAG